MKALALAALLLALPAAAFAVIDNSVSLGNTLDRDNELSALLGLYSTSAKITGNAADKVAKPGPLAGLRWMYNLDTFLAAGLQLDAALPGPHDSAKLLANTTTRSKLTIGEALLDARYRFLQENFRPYALLGLGVHVTQLKLVSQPTAGNVWADTGTTEARTLVDSRKRGAAVLIEGGFDYHLNNDWSLGASLGYHYSGKSAFAPTAAGKAAGLTGVSGAMSGIVLGGSVIGRY